MVKKIIAHKSIKEDIEKVYWSRALEKANQLLKNEKYKEQEKNLKDIIMFVENKMEQVKRLKEKLSN